MAQKDVLTLNIPEIVTLNQIAFSSDSTLLAAAGSNGLLYVWDILAGELKVALSGHTDQVIDVSFSPIDNNLLVSYSKDGTVRLWDTRIRSTIKILSGFQGDVEKMSFSPDGSVLHIFTNTQLQTFDTTTWEMLSSEMYTDPDVILLQELRSNEVYIEDVAGITFSPDGQTLAIGSSSLSSPVVLWDVPSKQIETTLETAAIRLIYSHQGNLLATVDRDGNISIWDTKSYIQLRTIKIVYAASIVFSPDDLKVAISSQGKIYIWDIQQDKIVSVIDTGSEWIKLLSYSSNGDSISAADGNNFSVRSWNLSTGEVLYTFMPPTDPAYREALNLSNDILAIFKATGLSNNTVELWNVITGEQIQVFNDVNDNFYPRLTYGPDRKVVAISYYYGITFYCTNTGKPIYFYDKTVDWIEFSFSPDGKYLAIGDDYGRIMLWDVSRIVQAPSCMTP